MTKAKTKMVRVQQRFTEYDLNFSDVKELVDKFSELQDPNFSVEGDSYYGDFSIVFSGYREETAQEKSTRLAAAKKERLKKLEAKVAVENKEKEQLASLLLKYHGILPEELHEWPT